MTLPGLPWIELTLREAQRCHHLAWFLYGCVEREHRLNLDACMAWWIQAFMAPSASIRRASARRLGSE